MSKYSTDELIDRICWKDDDRVLGPNDPYYPIGEETKNAIIARLRAADKLCEAANPIVGEISNFADNDLTEYQVIRFKDLVRLRKAIANYEVGK